MQKLNWNSAASQEDIAVIAALGEEIWRQHYTQLLGKEQVDYMLEKYQSREALQKQLENGYTYWLIRWEGIPCGYCGFVREGDRLFLSKLYLQERVRGKGIARAVVEQLCRDAASQNLRAVYLTVNKYNTGSIGVYQKLGFQEIDAVETDIGHGFIMDDYIMELPIAEGKEF
ncbi:MAG: GNAT family N-acetyltransferase [Candidatus Merdivicinus sp.]|jgi:RimJ/RimL family protein N-acetyltransferase